MRNILLIIFLVCLILGCGVSINEITEEDTGVFFYYVDEITGGCFGNLKPELSMNEWFTNATYPPRTYDAWSQSTNLLLYKDEDLETAFTGADLINKDTIIYCSFPFNGMSEKTGEISGSITLTEIPHPLTVVHIQNTGWIDGKWWSYYRRIDMTELSSDKNNGTFLWSLPIYDNFVTNSQSTFSLSVLSGDSLNPYTIFVQGVNINDVNQNNINLGTVNIGGVTLSGTLNVTYQGKPVPYLEIYAKDDGSQGLNSTSLSSPGKNAPWSLTFAKTGNQNTNIELIIYGFSKKDYTTSDFIIDTTAGFIVNVTNNQSVSGIEIDLGDLL